MPTNRDPDDPTKAERTPFNIRADYRETDRCFRTRLDAMIPTHLSDRVKSIIASRFNMPEGEEDAG